MDAINIGIEIPVSLGDIAAIRDAHMLEAKED